MLKDLKVCTISKYPPYMSGHSFEALYQGKALFEMTGEKHFEVTYDPSVYDKETTRVGGVPEAAGSHSIYAKHSSPAELAEKIALVLDNKVDRQAMIDSGIEYVKKFNYSVITRTFVHYLEECHP